MLVCTTKRLPRVIFTIYLLVLFCKLYPNTITRYSNYVFLSLAHHRTWNGRNRCRLSPPPRLDDRRLTRRGIDRSLALILLRPRVPILRIPVRVRVPGLATVLVLVEIPRHLVEPRQFLNRFFPDLRPAEFLRAVDEREEDEEKDDDC